MLKRSGVEDTTDQPEVGMIYTLRANSGRPMIIHKEAITVFRGGKELVRFSAVYEVESDTEYVSQDIIEAVVATLSKEKIKVFLPEVECKSV